MSQAIWIPSWEKVPGSRSSLWVNFKDIYIYICILGVGFLLIIPECKLILSSICEQIAALVSC